MFCAECGFQIEEKQKFCDRCGATTRQANTVQTSGQENKMDVFNRNVQIQYLYQLRMLEFSKRKLNQLLQNTDSRINSLGYKQSYTEPTKPKSIFYFSEEEGFIGTVLFGGGGVVVGLLLGWINRNNFINDFFEGFFGKAGTVLIILGIIILISYLCFLVFRFRSGIKKYYMDMEEYNRAIKNDELRVDKELEEKKNLSIARLGVYREWEKINTLLSKAYNINVIPTQYRNIYAIYYLYEFLSTSHETLTGALLHFELNEIKQKLDKIIQQQQEIIIQQAITNARLDDMQRQNMDIIKHASATANNTQLAAQYAQVAAVNTEAIAFLGIANYLKKQ